MTNIEKVNQYLRALAGPQGQQKLALSRNGILHLQSEDLSLVLSTDDYGDLLYFSAEMVELPYREEESEALLSAVLAFNSYGPDQREGILSLHPVKNLICFNHHLNLTHLDEETLSSEIDIFIVNASKMKSEVNELLDSNMGVAVNTGYKAPSSNPLHFVLA